MDPSLQGTTLSGAWPLFKIPYWVYTGCVPNVRPHQRALVSHDDKFFTDVAPKRPSVAGKRNVSEKTNADRKSFQKNYFFFRL